MKKKKEEWHYAVAVLGGTFSSFLLSAISIFCLRTIIIGTAQNSCNRGAVIVLSIMPIALICGGLGIFVICPLLLWLLTGDID